MIFTSLPGAGRRFPRPALVRYNKLTTRSASPFSPNTTFSFEFVDTFCSTSNSAAASIRVVFQQLCRIGLRTHGRSLFSAGNQVRFCRLFGFHHLIQQGLHLAGQDDIPNAKRGDGQTEDLGSMSKLSFQSLCQRILIGQ